MPKNSRVGKMYDAMVEEGMPKAKAAKISQARTGQSLSTGKPVKTSGGKPKAPKTAGKPKPGGKKPKSK